MVAPRDILNFWLDEVGPSGWYEASDALDQEIRDKFGDAWQAAADGAYGFWLTHPNGALAYVILMDQFPRNMFRGEGKAFATDGVALAAAKLSIDNGWDLKVEEPARQFFYLPLMHSESLCDQDRCVRLMAERMPMTGEPNLLHAKAHREVIRKFGRFPYRSEALERSVTKPEQAFLDQGGYGATIRQLQAAE
ncbi:DUF924 family protein [Pseudooceanicola sp. 502str34]|uniref:DUF924 family protein n=1 Tax=Maritimibacter alkaliphilus TaxID=404236 RepID=UPI001C96CDB0|nr:DUF924 family protein [Maritimibacter alkaliphilus]MBY6089147.1 DUF924 domain-containing protein [Maritimibacter alkaliphilus]